MAAVQNTLAPLITAYSYELDARWLNFGIEARLISRQGPVVASGLATAALTVKLPGNAVVRAFELELRADRASWTALGAAGQVRAQGGTVVVDFGLPRTVAGIGVQAGSSMRIKSVSSWTGAKFNPIPEFTAATPVQARLFPGEILTSRLQIELAATANAQAVESEIAVQLPDLPADLELRIDGGAPVFTHKGPVRSGERGWTSSHDRTTLRVSVADALAALTGNSRDPQERTFALTLSAQAPGILELVEAAREVDRVWLTELGPDDRRELDFDSEGFTDVALNVPDTAGTLRELRATFAASFASERALPPVGPPRSARAELILSADRAAAARLSSTDVAALSELLAVRLPITAGAQGAELRIALAEHDPDADAPGDLTRAVQSKPLVLAPGARSESWVTLELPAPFKLDEDALPWIAVLLSRGELVWSLAPGDASSAAQLRCGSPAGPWQPLPDYLTTQAACAARLRLVGHAGKAQPIAPLQGEACAQGAAYAANPLRAELNANAKGIRNVWPAQVALRAGQPLVLRVTSRQAGKLTLSALEAVVTGS